MVLLSIPTRLGGRSKSLSPKSSSPPTRIASPKPMADSTLVLRTTVVKGRNLAPKDRNGFSDPYVVMALGDYRFTTEAIPKTLDPVWNATYDMPLSGVNGLVIECVCWDKDRFGKDYMGEFEFSLDEAFAEGSIEQEPRWFTLKSTRKNAKISGEIQLQFALADSANPFATPEELLQKWRMWLGAFGGTPQSEEEQLNQQLGEAGVELDDEDEESSDGVEEPRSTGGPKAAKPTTKEVQKGKKAPKKHHGSYEFYHGSEIVGVVYLEISKITDLPPEHNMTRTGFDMDPFVVVSLGKKVYRTRHIRHCLNPVYDEKMVFQILRHEQNYQISFVVIDRDKLSGNDYVADTLFSLQEVIATQTVADPSTGLYYLPEPLKSAGSSPVSGAKSKFRLPISRSASSSSIASRKNLRPELVHQSSSSSIKNGGNGLEVVTNLQEDITPQPSPTKSMTAASDSSDFEMKPFILPLNLKNKERWEDKHKPELYFKAKYVPYPALRQQFWRCILRQYDADDSGMISRIELTTMLDSLGSTLTEETINGFFRRFYPNNDNIEGIELTMDQAVICLEEQLDRISRKHDRLHIPHISLPTLSVSSEDLSHDQTSGVSGSSTPSVPSRSQSSVSVNLQSVPTLGPAGEDGTVLAVTSGDGLNDPNEKAEEHVIQIKECPLCHQPRLNKRSEVDIVTHLATCASQDWRQVDRLVMGGFVTSSQAQRKWYSKVITKISYGGYKLGANSANILVQDRVTGQVQEERMGVYVRLGIRLLYKGLKSSSMENKKIRKLLESLSIKQGKKFDAPNSVREIKPFIEFHQLNLSEVLLPLEEFKSFNEFFYRALKPGARPCTAPNNPKIIVAPADCRSVVFNTIDMATKIWIKGRDFTVKRLLGSAYPDDAKLYDGGALGIFRLAPQDYHRFHIPVDGVLDEPKLIKGEYYTVNPMAIRSALDVYGENVRIICPIDSEHFGRVTVICVGAMMVGSTVITAKAGQKVARADELGYFQFGGSTLVVLFEPGKMRWDDDLVSNSKGALETLIRVGMSVGHALDVPQVIEHKKHATSEEMAEAKRRIEGSMAPLRD